MMKRFLIFLVSILSLVIVFTSCGSNDNGSLDISVDDSITQIESESDGSSVESAKYIPLEIKESAYIVRDLPDDASIGLPDEYKHWVEYAIILHNPNENLAVESPTFRITARDENDLIVGTEDQALTIIYPGQDFACAVFSVFFVSPQVTKVDFEILNPDAKNIIPVEKLNHQQYIPLEVIGANISSDHILGEVSNANEYDIDSAAITVIFRDENGVIVGGDTTVINMIPAGGKTPFDFDNLAIRSGSITNNYEIYANNWGYGSAPVLHRV
jgi:hypothetical protein